MKYNNMKGRDELGRRKKQRLREGTQRGANET
jgi:hypothetical protein